MRASAKSSSNASAYKARAPKGAQAAPVVDCGIGDLAKEFGISTRSIRLYEVEGLLHPSRTSNGRTRVFSAADRTRLRLTLRGKRLGFSLHEIKSILDLYDGPGSSQVQLREFLATLLNHKQTLEAKLQDLQMQLEEMRMHEKNARKFLKSN